MMPDNLLGLMGIIVGAIGGIVSVILSRKPQQRSGDLEWVREIRGDNATLRLINDELEDQLVEVKSKHAALEQEMRNVEARMEARWQQESRHIIATMSALAHENEQRGAVLRSIAPYLDWIAGGCQPPPPPVSAELARVINELRGK